MDPKNKRVGKKKSRPQLQPFQPTPTCDFFTAYRDPYQHQLVDDKYEDETNQDEAFDDVRDLESEDEVPEEDEQEVEVEEVDTRGKKPVSGGRAKIIPWNGEDEALLAKAYFHISTDARKREIASKYDWPQPNP